MKRIFTFLLVLALLPLCATAENPEPSDFDRSIDGKFRQFSAICGEVVIAKDGEIVYQRSYGNSYVNGKTAVTPDHYYRLASVSKIITQTALMRLVETGRLDLDENIGNYLYLEGGQPFFAASPRHSKTGITSRMLMTHTSSIWFGRYGSVPPIVEALDIRTNKKYKDCYYEETAGTKYHYSNEGVGILGCMIEAITGKRLDEAVSELIFDRMGIDAGFAPEYLDVPENVTSDVERQYGENIDLDQDYVFAYGNCWMKCADLCRIGIMLCDYGMYNGERILEEESVREMMSSQKGKGGITADVFGLNTDQSKVPYIVKDKVFYGHHGLSANCLCAMFYEPESRFVFSMVSYCTNPKEKQERIDGGLRALPYNLLKLTWNEFGTDR